MALAAQAGSFARQHAHYSLCPKQQFQTRPRLALSHNLLVRHVSTRAVQSLGGAQLHALLTPFSDPRCNTKLLALAVGQMLCSVATLIHDSYLPVYLSDELHISNTKIGAVQGAAQFLCQLSKGVAGVAGDLLGSQVRVLVFGTVLTMLCKPMFALLSSVHAVFGVTAAIYWLFSAKLLDRLSKGVRDAPAKALINELARESGDAPDAAYGLRQALATAGMLLGSTIASLTFLATGRNYIMTFAVAMAPPAAALLWTVHSFRDELVAARKRPPVPPATPAPIVGPPTTGSLSSVELPPGALPERPNALPGAKPEAPPPTLRLSPLQKATTLLAAFRPVYWQALAVVAVLYMARFDASFLSLRAKQVLDKSALPLLTLTNSVIQMLLTAPLARLSGTSVAARNRLLLAGLALMVVCDACFALPVTANPLGMFLGAALLGLHMSMTHAITVSMVASYMPTGEIPGVGKVSGTAVSVTDLLLGVVLAASNTLAGVLSDASRVAGYGNIGCFVGGAAASALSGVLLVLFARFGGLGREDLVVRRPRIKAA